MLLLKHNTLDSNDLITIERQYLRWSKHKGSFITSEFNVLDCSRTDLYGHLMGIFEKLGILNTLNITVSQFLDFLVDIDSSYHSTPYHTFYHAADIVIILYFAVTELEASTCFTNKEIATLFIAAICHDVGHPGFNNDFQVKTRSDLAIRYNNISVLESHSIALSIPLIEKHGLFKGIDYMDLFRKLILSTDMAYHYDLLQEARDLEEDPFFWFWDDKRRTNFAKILLHAADISNTVRVWPISKQWSDLIVQEFFQQGDAERSAGLAVSPGMDRALASQASISLRFGDLIVKPYFEAVYRLLPKASVWIDALEQNRIEWEKVKRETPLTAAIRRHGSVSIPAGTVLLPSLLETKMKPMRILRASSHSNILIPPQSSISSELRRNSVQHIVS